MTDSFEQPDIPLPSEPHLSVEYVLGESTAAYEEFDGYEFDINATAPIDRESEEIVLGWSEELKEQEARLAYIKGQLTKAAEVLIVEGKTDGSIPPPSAKSTKQPLFQK